MIEPSACNIIVEYLFNNKEINTNIPNESIENEVFDCLIWTKCIFIFNNNHKKITNNNKKGK